MDNNPNINECIPYNCLSNPEVEVLGGERIETGYTPIDISLSLTQFLLSEFVPGAGFVLGLVDIIWGIFGPSQWDAFLVQIEQLINQRIENSLGTKPFLDWKAKQSLSNLRRIFREWEADPTNPALREEMRIQFNARTSALTTAIPLFAVQNYQVPLLSVYVQAANLMFSTRRVQPFSRVVAVTPGYQSRYNFKRCYWGAREFLEDVGAIRDKSNFKKEDSKQLCCYLGIFRLSSYFFKIYEKFRTRVYPISESKFSPINKRNLYKPSIKKFSMVVFEARLRARRKYWSPHLWIYLNQDNHLTDVHRGFNYWSGHQIIASPVGFQDPEFAFPLFGNAGNAAPPVRIVYQLGQGVYRTLSSTLYEDLFIRDKVINTYLFLAGSNLLMEPPHICHPGRYRKSGTVDSLDEIPHQNNNVPPRQGFSHRLSHVSMFRSGFSNSSVSIIRAPMFSWILRSAEFNNIIPSSQITQIPLTKSTNLGSGTSVVKGPGFTGGDILRRTSPGQISTLRVNITAPLSQRYRVRIRYASTTNLQFHTSIDGRPINQGNFSATMSSGSNLQSASFRTVGFTTPFNFSNGSSVFTLSAHVFNSGNEVYIDRIEFVPAEVTFEAEYDLERAQKAVNELFTSSNQIGLKTDVTDYHIDQVSNLVECLSDEFCLDEKQELSEKVKHAKRLSDERNLLQDPNFRGINRQLDRGWRGSTDITIQGGDDVFKENYVTLLGTFDECYPTYLYQKIDESKLKAYTRYQLRGYIEDSQDLESIYIRESVESESVDAPRMESDLRLFGRDGQKMCPSFPSFLLRHYVGCTDLNEDLGVWVIFKIKTQDGHARLGNLEFLEEKPLVGEALARVKRAEKKWRDKREKLEWETNIVYKEAKESVHALFVNSQYDQLQAETNIAMIHAADKRVHSIRKAYLPELAVIPGVNAGIFEELEGRIFTAFSLYDARNVIKNGAFEYMAYPAGTERACRCRRTKQPPFGPCCSGMGSRSVTRSSCLSGSWLYPSCHSVQGGIGEGCVTIHEIENNTDELKFSNCVEEEVYPNNTVTCKIILRLKKNRRVPYTSRNRGYDGAYESNSSVQLIMHQPMKKKHIQMDEETILVNLTEDMGITHHYQRGYVTKELEYFQKPIRYGLRSEKRKEHSSWTAWNYFLWRNNICFIM
uniref:Crystaline entomocidal protoxin n=1 Tax=Bacillus thuringiensis serovar kunthalanags3 TaxID=147287 RepID=Q9AM80_BACTU|nr:insecticidal crystal protein BTRX3 [Bacillus thuringiensis serovar kunthalanags3]